LPPVQDTLTRRGGFLREIPSPLPARAPPPPRRARGLPLWFSLATHGTAQYRATIDHGIRLARRIADEIEARDGLSLVREPQLSVVVFRRDGWTLADYQAWSDRLLDDQVGFVVPSAHAGEPVLRFAIISPLTTWEKLVEILDTLA